MPADERDVVDVLRFYPQIYLACHVDHVRVTSNAWQLSARDSSILAHLDRTVAISPRDLAQHLGVQPSTLSAVIARLESLGYLTSSAAPEDKRRRRLLLTERGAEAMAATSVLDRDRVRLLLSGLADEDRKAAVRGLELLAHAARSLRQLEEQ